METPMHGFRDPPRRNRLRALLNPPPAALMVLLLGVPASLAAQATEASIRGTVRESDGAAVPGAAVSLRNESTGFQASTVASANGAFAFDQLPLGGPYTVAARMFGYQAVSKTGVNLSQGQRVDIQFELTTLAVALEAVEVVGASTGGFRSRDRRLSASTSVTQSDLRALPTADRTFTNLQQLSPVIGTGGNIFGQSDRNNSIMIDGVNAREAAFGGAGDSPYKLSMRSEEH